MDDQKTNCKCGKSASGWKCSNMDCGAKSEKHDPEHKHEGSNTCEPCCSGCEEAESNCNCGEMTAPI